MRNTKMNETTTSRVMSWPSKVSIIILLTVGYGVRVVRNVISESQDGCRSRRTGVFVTFPVPAPRLSDVVVAELAKALENKVFATE
jgi:hypothetical protein